MYTSAMERPNTNHIRQLNLTRMKDKKMLSGEKINEKSCHRPYFTLKKCRAMASRNSKILDAMQTGLRVKIGPSSRTEGLLKHLTYKGRIENQPGTTQRSLIFPPKNYFSDSIEKP